MNNNLTPSKRKTSGEQILTPITPNKTAKKQNSEEQLIKRLLADDPDRIKKEKLCGSSFFSVAFGDKTFHRRRNAIARISPAKEKEEMSLMTKRMMADFCF